MRILSFVKSNKAYVAVFAIALVFTVVVTAVLIDIAGKKREAMSWPLKVVEIPKNEIDPALWGKNFPFEYDTFVKTEIDYGATTYGGSRMHRSPGGMQPGGSRRCTSAPAGAGIGSRGPTSCPTRISSSGSPPRPWTATGGRVSWSAAASAMMRRRSRRWGST